MTIGSEILDDGTLLISYYNEQGKIDFINKRLSDHEMFNWIESATPSQFKNWDGRFVKKGKSNGRYITQFRIQELILEKLNSKETDSIYNFDNLPKKTYLDIEIKLTSDEFPDPDKAAMPVGLISFCDEDNTTYVLSILDDEKNPNGISSEDIVRMEKEVNEYFLNIIPLKPEDKKLFEQNFKIKYKFFGNEEEMLTFYFHKVAPRHSFLTGWNFTGFDWKYLMNRAKNLKIDATAAFPTKSIFSRNKIPTHLGILDYMEVFERLKPYKVVENYKLDYISHLVLNATKLKHGYPSFYEFQKDTYLYTKYNVIDVILVKLIEDKLSILDVAFSIANVAQVEVNKVFSPVYIAEILICRELLNKNQKMMKLPWGESTPDATYAGAYVMPPIPDHYNYVACYDFASMYPNIQMQFNISPDSYLGKTCDIHRKGNEIITKNDTLFDGSYDSVARTILNRLYNERVATKGEIKQLEKNL